MTRRINTLGMQKPGRHVLFGLALLLGACAQTAGPPPKPALSREPAPPMPEAASGSVAKAGWSSQRFMVAAANPLATQAGYEALKAGGSAVDAAIAVQMVLALVEPQSSGLGGGAFLLHWDPAAPTAQRLVAWDGREVAPRQADENLFMQPDGKPMPFAQAVLGGRSVGVPGVVRMLEAAHRAHGRLPWAQLVAPAVALAEQGFAVSHRLHTLVAADTMLRQDPLAKDYFFDAQGRPHPVGHRLRNPALAQVLGRVAREGSSALHEGAVAQDIVQRVRQHPTNPGRLSLEDMRAYEPVRRSALCTEGLSRYLVCGFPPPSSGHLTMMQVLGMLAPELGPRGDSGLDEAWLHRYTEAARLAFADRAVYIADPAFVGAPGGDWATLLAPSYLQSRAALIGPRSVGVATPGDPSAFRAAVGLPRPVAGLAQPFGRLAPPVGRLAPPAASLRWGSMPQQPESGTSHVSIVDGEGRALAMTTTIEAAFGARLMSDGGSGLAGGFLLNNQLTDFALNPRDAQGRLIANRVQPGKRPRSSMSPTLVFDPSGSTLVMSVGSPGGAAIIHYTAKTLVGTLAWGLDAQAAIALPNFGTFNGPTLLEKDRFPHAVVAALEARGHTVQRIDMVSGLQAIQRTPSGWFGGADPRREGAVMGD